MRHILLKEQLFFRKIKEILPLSGFYYDKQAGAWISSNKKFLLVNQRGFASIASKKKDVETGEDQK